MIREDAQRGIGSRGMVVEELVRKRGDEVGTRWERWKRCSRWQRICFDGEVSGGLAIGPGSVDGWKGE